ncbi:hypothetical protein HPC38_01200 [Pasteurellaceae bacterium HPA106]|uniref:hypothetical protein n=1 Tax=Spirabiliibacterium pneumoniae TaxID=221400 RepID=UPI001AAC9BE2|nr:hypothetical protein [Spirabiliibacterium pneumoniae]MBE2895498.1 hypothetical protein [Spirabiliibacterium pneumoniae]
MTRITVFALTALLPLASLAANDPFHHQMPTTTTPVSASAPCGQTELIMDSPIEQYKPVGLIIHNDKPHILLKLGQEVLLAEPGQIIGNTWQIDKVEQQRITLRHCGDKSEKIWHL